MASTVSITTTTINNLIQQVGEVTVCQDHWKLIATSLNRLQNVLNKMNTVAPSDSDLYEDINRTLTAIDEIVVSCNENEVDLNGMTYRELESLLSRLQLRLTQHEVDMTNDYEVKVQILSKAYHEQQILAQKAFDETMRQRLQAIEQRTQENIIEQLHILREKHINTIQSYLHGCTELHKNVPTTGFTTDIVTKVACTYYHITYEHQMQLERQWQAYELPLTRTFVQFKADKSTSFERNEARRLLIDPEVNLLRGSHCRTESSNGIWQRLVSAPYMMSMLERDRKSEEEDVSEENIIRSKRWIVILGDPGSGKTSFARWLVCHLAQTLLLNGQHSTDYGPLRIPILIRIGEFAEMLKEQPSLTLFRYIGKHKWMGKVIVNDLSISVDDLSCALQDYIRHGQALIILDGLDEIPVSDQRSKIISIVENFVDTYVQTPTGTSVFDNPHLSKLFDDPSRSGGNQLMVTSRIVGYHAAPLAGQFSHYTIRPMDMEHMKDFVGYWFFRMHQQILDTLGLSVPNQGENHGEALKKELEKEDNIGLRDIASNSCLMSFICNVAFGQVASAPLPTQRICLYEQIVNSMLTLWSSKQSTICIPDLIRILSNIASYIHEHSASGLIHEEKLKEICIQSIKASIGRIPLTEEDIENIERQACEFVRIIREYVGVLAARGESLYGFLHLTFQEYFTCLKLIDINHDKQKKSVVYEPASENIVQLVAQSLRRHSNDPRFRVPIALALGKISSSWFQKDFDDFCYGFIQEEDEFNFILSLGAYMLISYSNDLVHYPSNDVLFNALNRLMVAAGKYRWSIVSPFLLDQITNALRKLRHEIVSLWINNLFSNSSLNDIQTISALCHLVEGKPHEFDNIRWLNQSSCSMLQSLLPLDNANNGFAVDRLLVKVAFSNHRLLPTDATTLKGFLLTEEIELHSIPVVLFPLIIALYGGLKRNDQTIVFNPSYIHRDSLAVTPILIRYLSIRDRAKQDQGFKKLKQECINSFLTRMESHDASSEAVDLGIATICLYGIEYIQDNITNISGSLLRMIMDKLKYVSMILRQFYFVGNANDRTIENEVTRFIAVTIEKFQYSESASVQFLNMLYCFQSSVARLRSSTKSILLEGESRPNNRVILYLPNSLRKEDKFLNGLLSEDVQVRSDHKSCSLLHHFINLFWVGEHNSKFDTQYRMAMALDTVPEYLVFCNNDVLFPLIFVPLHLRNLCLRLLQQKFIITGSKNVLDNDKRNLYFGHILLDCLMSLSNSSCKRLSLLAALVPLLPMLRMHQLENFGSSLFWVLESKDSSYLAEFEAARSRPMSYETGLYTNGRKVFVNAEGITAEQRRELIVTCIMQEQQRLHDVISANDTSSTKLYSACVSLARICRWSADERKLSLLNESVQGAMLITSKIARLDALSVIALYSYSEYNQIQVGTGRSIQEEIEHQFDDIYRTLPLLLHATIFIRCLPLLQCQSKINQCLQNLFDKFADNDQRDQQAVNEALLPYVGSFSVFSPVTKFVLHNSLNENRIGHNRSSLLKKHFNIAIDQNLPFSILIPNLYLVELAKDFQECVKIDVRQFATDESIVTTLCQFENTILTEAQAMTITYILSSFPSRDRSHQTEKLCFLLCNALHRVDIVDFKARPLLERWLRWRDSNELSSFASHAALLLTNSDLWSAEAATIICDLLCSENDRFRQRAEMILRTKEGDNNVRTSSKLGINVLLALAQKRICYCYTSAFASLTVARIFCNMTLDNQFHLETLLWLERYRIHNLHNKNYSVDRLTHLSVSNVIFRFPTVTTMNISFCGLIYRMSNDLILYLCDMIASNLFSFLEIDGDTASNEVLESHNQFVISVIITVGNLLCYTDEVRLTAIDALTKLFEICNNDSIRRAAVFAMGYICHTTTYKILFKKVESIMDNQTNETLNASDCVLTALISSYCHCVSVNRIDFDQADIDLFRVLLKYSSQNVLRAVHVGLARVLKNSSLLHEMLDFDRVQCYEALIRSTGYVLIYDVQRDSEDAAAEYIEQHPDILPIFVVELYNSVRHFTNIVSTIDRVDYYFNYGYPHYVGVASLIAVRMPAAFCAYVKDWHDGEKLKRALFYTSKQYSFPQRAACLTVLSIFGELTVELCEMFVEALRDDPHVQNTSYKCLIRINTVKDENAVLSLLLSYLKSKSMNVRYVAVKILLHLSRSSLISFKQVRIVLNDLILDPSSKEDLWLIEEQDGVVNECIYYYAGPLKDAVYSLIVQHLTGDASRSVRRNNFNEIDSDYIESEKASRLASCLYETRAEANVQ